VCLRHEEIHHAGCANDQKQYPAPLCFYLTIINPAPFNIAILGKPLQCTWGPTHTFQIATLVSHFVAIPILRLFHNLTFGMAVLIAASMKKCEKSSWNVRSVNYQLLL
jgi:hypothetical protein